MNKGDLIGKRYQLDRSIGQGGSGRIWLAQDTRLDRRVAIKFLLASNAYRRVRYARRVALEAKIAASIQHHNVVQIFDFGTHEDQTPYIVMEALTGFTLGEAFDDAHTFSLDALIHIMSEVLRGLAAVHDAGIVHRDLKPENIFLVKEGREKLSPKLLDFGISRSLEPESRRSAVTTTEGMIIGTPQYMSPEQARGDMRIDKGTDIYSIGTIMFEAFAGVVPFPAQNVSQLLVAVITSEAPAMFDLAPSIGKPLCAVVDKALKKDRAHRYQDAAEMHDALLAAAEQVPAELDRSAPLFPPEKIKARALSRRPRGDDATDGESEQPPDDSEGPPALPTRETVHERGRPRRLAARDTPSESDIPLSGASPVVSSPDPDASPSGAAAATQKIVRSLTPARYAFSLGVLAVLSLGVAIAAVIVLRDRTTAPVGTGMIVVQAPTPSPAATAAQIAEAEPSAAAGAVATKELEVEPVAEANAPERKAAAPKARKPSAAAPASSDPMQQMTTGVASAFAKQKASVIDCLNKYPDQVESSPQLTVRVSIDKRGKVTQAELLPETISSKSVGSCVRNAVSAMTFPTPEQPMTFRVPLMWRRK
ncbi:MAG TPA: protein kinase [Polyangiales bacterium]|nr:protein kinase [Polyangiales bacterium]